MKRVSLSDVARAAGVGKATVSRALSGHDEVGAATRARVLDIAADMGYTPHAAARTLRTGRAQVLAVSLDVRRPGGHPEDLAATLLLALARAGDRLGYRVLVDLREAEGTGDPWGHLDGLAVDGVLVVGPEVPAPRPGGVPVAVVRDGAVPDVVRALQDLVAEVETGDASRVGRAEEV